MNEKNSISKECLLPRVVMIIFSVYKLSFLVACGLQNEFDSPASKCTNEIPSVISYSELKAMVQDRTLEIQEELTIGGYVISSDKAGNFFNSIHIQDKLTNEAQGFQLELELRDSYLLYPPGTKIYIKLQGLFISQSRGLFKIGGAYSNFGSLAVGRLPTLAIKEHIFISCDDIAALEARKLTIDAMEDRHLNTLIYVEGLEIIEDHLDLSYAEPQEETIRSLQDCTQRTIGLQNSGYSDFQTKLLPEGNGSLTGVLVKDGKDFVLKIRDTNDLQLDGTRCIDQRVSSDSIYISEIADPDNESKARFVELFNSSTEGISLDGWKLNRYTNANTEIGSTIELNGQVVQSQQTLVISPNTVVFENIYGFAPDMEVGTNSPADSNGDDNLELVDPFGNVIDRFGIPGEDGTGTNHEFEDGGAFRKEGIQKGNPEYTFEEWVIYNDSGMEGTILQPLIAPEDFGPKER